MTLCGDGPSAVWWNHSTHTAVKLLSINARMSQQVICLSDSEESVRSLRNEDVDDTDYNFPPVNFHYDDANDSRDMIDKPNEEVNATSPINVESGINRAGGSRLSELLGKYSNNSESTQHSDNTNKKPNNKAQKNSAESAFLDEAAKEIRATLSRDKSSKLLEKQNRKKMQPGECLKSVQLSIDQSLTKFGFHSALLNALDDSDISYKLDSLPIENSIIWMRNIEYLNESTEISAREKSIENEIVIIWNWDETVRRVDNGSFASSLENMATLMPDKKKVMLIIFGMEEYFQCHTKNRRKNIDKGSSLPYASLPKISRQDLEMCLAEIQLMIQCNSILVDNLQELSMLVYRLTKSIAEKPFKLEKRQRLEEKIDWYAMGDNRDTVRVDKNGNGLKRLWQQQLCQFNLASLETAEAISSVFPSPFLLMQAYGNCTSSEGEKLLSEIQIRRAAGPLSAARKIGPELSKKIFMTFTSNDGDTALVNDR